MKFSVCPKNQGQSVEVAYAAFGSNVIRRITDQSIQIGQPGRVQYAISKMLVTDEGDYWQTEPANRRWKTISGAEVDELEKLARDDDA